MFERRRPQPPNHLHSERRDRHPEGSIRAGRGGGVKAESNRRGEGFLNLALEKTTAEMKVQ